MSNFPVYEGVILTPEFLSQEMNYHGQAYHRHPFGGGWVCDAASVAATAYVGPFAMVMNKAVVEDRVCLQDRAVVYGHAIVRENVRVMDVAIVCGHAQVRGQAIIKDHAVVRENACVEGKAKVEGSATVRGNARMSEHAVAKDFAVLTYKAKFTGTAVAEGNSVYDADILVASKTGYCLTFDERSLKRMGLR